MNTRFVLRKTCLNGEDSSLFGGRRLTTSTTSIRTTYGLWLRQHYKRWIDNSKQKRRGTMLVGGSYFSS